MSDTVSRIHLGNKSLESSQLKPDIPLLFSRTGEDHHKAGLQSSRVQCQDGLKTVLCRLQSLSRLEFCSLTQKSALIEGLHRHIDSTKAILLEHNLNLERGYAFVQAWTSNQSQNAQNLWDKPSSPYCEKDLEQLPSAGPPILLFNAIDQQWQRRQIISIWTLWSAGFVIPSFLKV